MTTTSSSAAAIGNAVPHIPTIPQEASNERQRGANAGVGSVLLSQYLRDLDALDAAGGDGGCFFTAMGDVIRARMEGSIG